MFVKGINQLSSSISGNVYDVSKNHWFGVDVGY